MKKTILLVDDEPRMRKLLSDFLSRDGYLIREADNGQSALEIAATEKIDLMILDVMMPVHDGWTVCRELRKTSRLPVILLTAKSEESDQLLGFELGADEYVTKPFSPRVLCARVNALFRRLEGEESLSWEGLMIDRNAHVVISDGETLELSPKEYDLLLFLSSNAGRALSREQILNQVWNYDYYGDLRTVDTHINRLRTKLGVYGSFVQTIRGFGYRFEAPR